MVNSISEKNACINVFYIRKNIFYIGFKKTFITKSLTQSYGNVNHHLDNCDDSLITSFVLSSTVSLEPISWSSIRPINMRVAFAPIS